MGWISKDVEEKKMTENKNLNMCYDNFKSKKMKEKATTKEISSLEQNGFVNSAEWKLKKPKYFFSHI